MNLHLARVPGIFLEAERAHKNLHASFQKLPQAGLMRTNERTKTRLLDVDWKIPQDPPRGFSNYTKDEERAMKLYVTEVSKSITLTSERSIFADERV